METNTGIEVTEYRPAEEVLTEYQRGFREGSSVGMWSGVFVATFGFAVWVAVAGLVHALHFVR